MKIAQVTLSVALTVFLVLFTGCTAREATSNTGARATPAPVSNANATANSNSSTPAAESNRNADAIRSSAASATPKPKSVPELIGTYESREVEKDGVVTVISKLRTVWMFSADGNYSRVSQVNGKTYHSDSGVFRIEAPDKLVLTIQVTGLKANRKIQSPPGLKTHKYSLSPDGDELRLISDKGAVGIFQRVTKPS